jgi:hypothetical protein
MSRTVAALYDSRAEAELARARLVSEVNATSPRILARDTVAAIDGLKIARADADAYRERLRRGGHLLVVEVPAGAKPKRIIELLEQSAGEAAAEGDERSWGNGDQGIRVELPGDGQGEQPTDSAPDRPPAPPQVERAVDPAPEPLPERTAAATPAAETPAAPPERELRIGNREVARSGARVRAVMRETEAEQQVALTAELVSVESRPSGRRLTDSEAEAGGLFTERVFEIAEMREEPVVTKVAVVREEVIVRKTAQERTETIRDTLRYTDVEV